MCVCLVVAYARVVRLNDELWTVRAYKLCNGHAIFLAVLQSVQYVNVLSQIKSHTHDKNGGKESYEQQ